MGGRTHCDVPNTHECRICFAKRLIFGVAVVGSYVLLYRLMLPHRPIRVQIARTDNLMFIVKQIYSKFYGVKCSGRAEEKLLFS